MDFFEEAAVAGHVRAQFNVGITALQRHRADPSGDQTTLNRALHFLTLAAEQRLPVATCALAYMHAQGLAVSQLESALDVSR
jgi:TPR repeat protein